MVENDRHARGGVAGYSPARWQRTAVGTAVFLLTLMMALTFRLVLAAGGTPGTLTGAPSAVLAADCTQDLNVSSPADSGPGSLRQALIDVCPGGSIHLDPLAGQTVGLTSPLSITHSLSILSSSPVTLSGGSAVRVLELGGPGLHVTLDGLGVADGRVSDVATCEMYYFQRIFCGAGLLINPGNFVTVTNTTFQGNQITSLGRGAGIVALTSQLTLQDDRFVANQAFQGSGGGVYVEGGILRVERSQFIANKALAGAGLFSGLSSNLIPDLSIRDSLFQDNQSSGDGGGIGLGPSVLQLQGSTFANNQAGRGGGLSVNGITNAGPTRVLVENNTFSANRANSGAGAHFFTAGLTLRSNTLANNQAAPGRAALEITPGSVDVFSDNLLSGNSRDCAAFTTPTILGSNNVFASPGGLACGATDGVDGNQVSGPAGLPAYLGSLGDYGGPTPTIPLLPGSLALDAGANCTTLDQRGVERAAAGGTGCDAGAFESHGFHLAALTGNGQSTRVNTQFPFPLVVSVSPLDPAEPVDGGVVSFTLPPSGASAALDSNPAPVAGGTAAPRPSANASSGSYTVSAHTRGSSDTPVFNLTNTSQEVVFDEDPQNPGPFWSTNQTTTSPCGIAFMGEFGNQTVSLTLPSLPQHAQALVTFDLYILKSWDGNQVEETAALQRLTGVTSPDGTVGPDRWSLAADGTTLLDTTFSNWAILQYRQAFPGAFGQGDFLAQTGATAVNSLCYRYQTLPLDSVYHLAYFLDHTAPSLKLDFSASGLQRLTDESWGLANVQVTVADPAFSKVFLPVIGR